MTASLAVAGSSPSGSGGRTWVTEIDPALSRNDGPLQVLRSPKPAGGKP